MEKKEEYPTPQDEQPIVNEAAMVYPSTQEPVVKGEDLKPPCQLTVEELREDAANFIERLEKGEVEFVSNEEVKKRFIRCN